MNITEDLWSAHYSWLLCMVVVELVLGRQPLLLFMRYPTLDTFRIARICCNNLEEDRTSGRWKETLLKAIFYFNLQTLGDYVSMICSENARRSIIQMRRMNSPQADVLKVALLLGRVQPLHYSSV